VETDASDYAFTAIFSIVNEDKLLTIFEAFKIWQHYLEGLAYPIDIVMDHKNLEYFSTTKVLTRKQVWWSEYLFQFNLVIRFHPGCLGTKLDALTKQWDVYPKGGNTGYTTVNPHNFKSIFTQEQLAVSVQATVLLFPSLCTATVMDMDTLYQDIP